MEVLLAIMLISLGLMGLYSMVISTIRGDTFNRNHMIATTLAQDRLERLKLADYDNVTPGNYPQEDYNTIAAYEQFQRTVTIEDDVPNANAKTIRVTVAWRNRSGAARNVRLATIITP